MPPTGRAWDSCSRWNGKETNDLPVRFQNGDLDIIPHRSDDLGELRMKIRADEIGVRLLQLDPRADEVGIQLTARNKRNLH